MNNDFTFTDHGSIWLLAPKTAAATEWISRYISVESQRWGRDQIVVESRYVLGIIDGIEDAGLSLMIVD